MASATASTPEAARSPRGLRRGDPCRSADLRPPAGRRRRTQNSSRYSVRSQSDTESWNRESSYRRIVEYAVTKSSPKNSFAAGPARARPVTPRDRAAASRTSRPPRPGRPASTARGPAARPRSRGVRPGGAPRRRGRGSRAPTGARYSTCLFAGLPPFTRMSAERSSSPHEMFDGLNVCGRRRRRQFTVGAITASIARAYRSCPAMKERHASVIPCGSSASPNAFSPESACSSEMCVWHPLPGRVGPRLRHERREVAVLLRDLLHAVLERERVVRAGETAARARS